MELVPLLPPSLVASNFLAIHLLHVRPKSLDAVEVGAVALVEHESDASLSDELLNLIPSVDGCVVEENYVISVRCSPLDLNFQF